MKTVGSQLADLLVGNGSLGRQVAPIARYVVFLGATVGVYGWLFHVIMAWEGQDHSWFTGVYWTLTVMSTLGFGDITFQSDLGRVFSTVVLLSGVVLLLIMLPFLFIRFFYAPWLEQRSRSRIRAIRAVPGEVTDHVLICTEDPIAHGLMRRLNLADVPAYLIEPDADLAMRMEDLGMPVITGQVDASETYRKAGASRARLVLANASDTVNSNIILTVRELSDSVPITATAESEDSIDVLELSGATHVLPLKKQLGEHLANRVSAGAVRANIIGGFHDLLLAEFEAGDTPLESRSLEESNLEERIGVRIVGVWEHGRLLPARSDLVLSSSSVPVVIGTERQVQALDELLAVHDPNPNPVIIIGGGKVGRSAARALKERGISVHIVERSAELESEIAGIPNRLFVGDAADRDVLDQAGIAETPSILLTTHDDAMNIYLTVYCRRLNPDARILTRVTHDRNVEAIQRAGADFVLSYASLGVQTILSLMRRRELVVLGEGAGLFYVPLPPSLRDRTLEEEDVDARTGLSIIGLERDGHLITNPPRNSPLVKGSVLVALGTNEHRELFDRTFAPRRSL